MNSNNTNDKLDILREILLQKFEEFLNDVEHIIGEKLPDSTRMKNISNFSLNINLIGNQKFQEELMKKFEIIKTARSGFIEDSINEKKTEIKSAEVYLIPGYYIKTLNFDTLYIVKKKDKLDNLKEGIKGFLDSFLPKPEYTHH